VTDHAGHEGLFYAFKDVNDYGKDVETRVRGNSVHAFVQVYAPEERKKKKKKKTEKKENRGNEARVVPVLRTWIVSTYMYTRMRARTRRVNVCCAYVVITISCETTHIQPI
jgi:hypothetical protein